MEQENILLTAIGGMTAALGAMWRWHVKKYDKLERNSEDCNKDRIELWKAISELNNKSCGISCSERQHVEIDIKAKRPKGL